MVHTSRPTVTKIEHLTELCLRLGIKLIGANFVQVVIFEGTSHNF